MKKIIIIAAALLAAWSANAQIGIVAGLTSSATDAQSAYADIKNVNQYHVGLTYKLGLGNLLAIQPSLIYNMKGTKIGEIGGVKDINAEYKTGYLELPVQVQAGLGIGTLLRVYGFAEPFVGYAINNEVKTPDLLNKESVQNTWDNVKSRFEYGVSLGAGVEVLRHLQVTVKYFWNLGSVYGNEITVAGTAKTISESKCNGVAASVAYLF